MEKLKQFLLSRRSSRMLLYIPCFVLLFFITERVVPTTGYWVSYLPLDDSIPFCEFFVIFYVLWYPLLLGTAAWLLIHDDDTCSLYCRFIIIGFTASLVFCLFFPNGQDLRPAVFANRNVFSQLVGLLYSVDTNTNVLPSMHVIGAMGACFGVFRSKTAPRWMRIAVLALTILINASTVFIKQHSILDVFVGVAISAGLYILVFLLPDRRFHKTAVPPSSGGKP